MGTAKRAAHPPGGKGARPLAVRLLHGAADPTRIGGREPGEDRGDLALTELVVMFLRAEHAGRLVAGDLVLVAGRRERIDRAGRLLDERIAVELIADGRDGML